MSHLYRADLGEGTWQSLWWAYLSHSWARRRSAEGLVQSEFDPVLQINPEGLVLSVPGSALLHVIAETSGTAVENGWSWAQTVIRDPFLCIYTEKLVMQWFGFCFFLSFFFFFLFFQFIAWKTGITMKGVHVLKRRSQELNTENNKSCWGYAVGKRAGCS